MEDLYEDEIRSMVRDNYAKIARSESGPCGCGTPNALPVMDTPCCGNSNSIPKERPAQDSTRMGYSSQELASVPEGADMGLGCGNPQAIAAIKPGETCLDLGSGGGFDSFLAAKQTGPQGHVIGVDMTPDMVSKARANAVKGGFINVEFRLGEIEHLPVADNTVDVILSNCVINLSPDKPAVYRDAFRVLKPGGRLAISDMISISALPDELQKDLDCYCGCITGTISADETERILTETGFRDIRIQPRDESKEFIAEWVPGKTIEDYVVSATIEAVKPG